MRQIDAAKQQWAMENNKKPTDTPTAGDITAYLGRGTGTLPTCPSGGTTITFGDSYNINDLATAPTCKVGAALDPVHEMPKGATT
jgi:hypothetical protein